MHQKNVGLSRIALKNKVVYKLALGSLPSHFHISGTEWRILKIEGTLCVPEDHEGCTRVKDGRTFFERKMH